MTFNKKTITNSSSPIKILFFIESLYQGGKERQLVELLKKFTSNPDFQSELVIMRKDVFYTEVFKLDINIHVIERKFIKKDPLIFFKFYNIAKHFKPDIVHVWGNMTAVYSLFAKTLLDFKLVNFQIQDAPVKPPSALINHKMTFHFSNIIIANSAAGLKAYGVLPSKSKVIRNGFDFGRIKKLEPEQYIRSALDISTKYVVGMVGRFSEDKDYATYINAANIILEKNNAITFLCIGHGNSEKYRKLVEPRFSDKIKFFPQQENIESIMNICNIGILSTFTEGIPNTIIEFMALGKPAIVTGGGGTKELVINGETGFLIPLKSPEILVEKIQYLLDNPDIAEMLGSNGCKRIKKDFSIAKMVNEFVNTYHEVANV